MKKPRALKKSPIKENPLAGFCFCLFLQQPLPKRHNPNGLAVFFQNRFLVFGNNQQIIDIPMLFNHLQYFCFVLQGLRVLHGIRNLDEFYRL